MSEEVFGVLDGILAVLFLALLARLAFFFGSRERDAPAIGSPSEVVHSLFSLSDGPGLTTVRPDEMELPLDAAVRGEGKPPAIG
jgi:hypothetical protein